MSATRAGLLASVVLLGGCAGWSSWEDGRGSRGNEPQRPLTAGQYRVVRGDTMYSIAFRNGLDYRELARWNGIGSDYLIMPGQILTLRPPGDGRTAVAAVPAVSRPATVATLPSGVTTAPVTTQRPATALPSGPISWIWPTQGQVVRGFGDQGSKGLDFTGNEGQPVFAAAPGRVVYSGNALKGYGELIIIKHDDEYLSAYGYNQSRHVNEGDLVTAGQPIGRMGRGPENKPLLHFEIRRGGRPIDPRESLPRQPS
ncbi:LysM peptidoglycan-binding domain-containing protein [Sinimarinibacterium sp. CAU 1509]|uniref:peptidoglycan DD-metalloendopeptidase family protein n=1 Tax=Sinimarinibacterium sp. CAU 1509 TaxID=2562283 RepID=UPI0010AD4FCA|nr:peptidoglycan DD-metalloendopeptidase family protein [Sinimarinibacterium sp. CAU 1509]TJY60911.1 LysM peptidoglycan-binding domain-containing protein [Sinimarinibacterium sp. CAU 1509]